MSTQLESRFEKYCDGLVQVLGHADRHQPARWYMKGLMLPGERKSIEPMAARVQPDNVRSAHQAMHHLVAEATWDDRALLSSVAQQVAPVLLRKEPRCWWILDDTAHAKKGIHSVGVARQYSGRLGKTDNCQVAVSLSLANHHGSLPLHYQLYLPREWTVEPKRCERAGVPKGIEFQTKGQIARSQIEATLKAGISPGVVLADAGYGDETDFREWLSEQQLDYVMGVRSGTKVWWGKHQAAPMPASAATGRPRTRAVRDAEHQPISLLELAHALPSRVWRTVSWREGSRGPLSSRFARVRVRAAHHDQLRKEEWLLIEWPTQESEPTHFWLSTLSKKTSCKKLVTHAHGRWMIERDYQELKSELGLSHYEGRNWRGFHHHATLCIAAYGFLMLERLSGKKNSARFKESPLPEGFRPRGSGADAASPTLVNRQRALSTRSHACSRATAMPVLWSEESSSSVDYLTQ